MLLKLVKQLPGEVELLGVDLDWEAFVGARDLYPSIEATTLVLPTPSRRKQLLQVEHLLKKKGQKKLTYM